MRIFLGFTFMLYSRSFSNTARRAARCAWKPLLWTMLCDWLSTLVSRVVPISCLSTSDLHFSSCKFLLAISVVWWRQGHKYDEDSIHVAVTAVVNPTTSEWQSVFSCVVFHYEVIAGPKHEIERSHYVP
jgi:hypothetical protein